MRRFWVRSLACLVGAAAGGCSLAFGIRDNEGPLVDGGTSPESGDVVDTGSPEVVADGGGEAHAMQEAGPPPPETWCNTEAGVSLDAGGWWCEDFDEPSWPYDGGPRVLCGAPTVEMASCESLPDCLSSVGPCAQVYEAWPVGGSKGATLDLWIRLDARDSSNTTDIPHLAEVVFSVGATKFTVGLDSFTTNLDVFDFGTAPNGRYFLMNYQKKVWYHLNLDVDLVVHTAVARVQPSGPSASLPISGEQNVNTTLIDHVQVNLGVSNGDNGDAVHVDDVVLHLK
jgi:hypothetical protein